VDRVDHAAGPAGNKRWRPRAPRGRRASANRLLWTIVGLVLLLGGVALALASRGVLGSASTTALVPPEFQRRWHAAGGWAFAAAIAAALLVALLGWLLLRAELRGRGGTALPDPLLERPTGRISVTIVALRHALASDLQNHPGVRRAGVELTGRLRHPVAYLRLTVAPEADLGEVREYVDAALDRFANTSGFRPELADVTVNLAGVPQRARVH
jgi:hypothetical protein